MPYTPTTWVEGVTDVGPTNMNHLETGVGNATTTADAAIPAPIGPASSAGLVWNGSSWVAAKIVNANIDAAAAIAYSKLSLAGGIVNNDVSGSAAIALSKLADPGAGNVVTSSGGGTLAAKPPGYAYTYDELTSAIGSISGTTVGTATTVKVSSSFTFDGSAVWVEFYSPLVTNSADGPNTIFELFQDSTDLGQLGYSEAAFAAAGSAFFGKRKVTPAAGAHTFTIKAFVSASTSTVQAGVGGVGALVPAYILVTKA